MSIERGGSAPKEVVPSEESSLATVKRFMDFTKIAARSEDSRKINGEWEHLMLMLYGDEDLARETQTQEYIVDDNVELALLEGLEAEGLSGMKAAFEIRLFSKTKVERLGDASRATLARIIDFE